MPLWAPFALGGITTALLAVPVAPALHELRKRRDAAPLPTSRHDGKISNFAEAFRLRIEPLLPLLRELEECRSRPEPLRSSIEGMEVLLVSSDSGPSSGSNSGSNSDFDFADDQMQGIAAVMCSQPSLIPAGAVVDADVYADSDLQLGPGAALRAGLSAGDIVLGKDSVVLRWLHAYGGIYLCQGSTAYGRLSADRSITLESGCGFERMHAPKIVTVDARHDDSHSGPFSTATRGNFPSFTHTCQSDADADDVFASSRSRIRVQGNFDLPAGETLKANVVATGELRLGRGARLLGSARSYQDTAMEENACVHGSIVCGGMLRLGPSCYAAGPVMVERDLLIERGSSVGNVDALTTVSCDSVQIAAGCQLRGTVWARERGTIEA